MRVQVTKQEYIERMLRYLERATSADQDFSPSGIISVSSKAKASTMDKQVYLMGSLLQRNCEAVLRDIVAAEHLKRNPPKRKSVAERFKTITSSAILPAFGTKNELKQISTESIAKGLAKSEVDLQMAIAAFAKCNLFIKYSAFNYKNALYYKARDEDSQDEDSQDEDSQDEDAQDANAFIYKELSYDKGENRLVKPDGVKILLKAVSEYLANPNQYINELRDQNEIPKSLAVIRDGLIKAIGDNTFKDPGASVKKPPEKVSTRAAATTIENPFYIDIETPVFKLEDEKQNFSKYDNIIRNLLIDLKASHILSFNEQGAVVKMDTGDEHKFRMSKKKVDPGTFVLSTVLLDAIYYCETDSRSVITIPDDSNEIELLRNFIEKFANKELMDIDGGLFKLQNKLSEKLKDLSPKPTKDRKSSLSEEEEAVVAQTQRRSEKLTSNIDIQWYDTVNDNDVLGKIALHNANTIEEYDIIDYREDEDKKLTTVYFKDQEIERVLYKHGDIWNEAFKFADGFVYKMSPDPKQGEKNWQYGVHIDGEDELRDIIGIDNDTSTLYYKDGTGEQQGIDIAGMPVLLKDQDIPRISLQKGASFHE